MALYWMLLLACSPLQDPPKEQEIEEGITIKPVEGEPAMPASLQEAKTKFKAVAMAHGAYTFDLEETITYVTVPGRILLSRGLVELFACTERGKEHEAVVRLSCDPMQLDLALRMAGLRSGRLSENGKEGSRVLVFVQWRDAQDKAVTYRSEDLLLDLKRKGTMPRVGWSYVADWVEEKDPTQPDPAKARTIKYLLAARSGSIIATFRDGSTLLDNPLEEAVDDTLFSVNQGLCPPSGTSVMVFFRAPTPDERKEIEKVEQGLK